MKTTFKLLYVAFSSIFILTLFSFTRNHLSRAAIKKTNTVTSGNVTATLLSDGTNTMVYTAKGMLSKVISTSFRTRTYASIQQQEETIYSASVYNNGTITNKYTYKLNSLGLASNITSEQFDNGKSWITWSDSCIYNTSGQLMRQINGNGHYDFIYNDKGDISNVKYYNYQNKLLRDINIFYTAPGTTLLIDRNDLVPEYLEVDPHLRIFGKFSSHLPTRVEYTDNATGGNKADYSYNYVLNDKGYIISRTKFITGSNKVIARNIFTYKG